MKKYLVYDDIVRGAGLGHIMTSYNAGLSYCIKNNLEWLPCKIKPAHDLNKYNTIEDELGLPTILEQERVNILQNHECEHIRYGTEGGICNDFSKTGAIYRDWYSCSRKGKNSVFLSSEKVNICISIRRGDIAAAGPEHHMASRLRPLKSYVQKLKWLINEHNISNYRLIISTDLRGGHKNCLVDRNNNPKNVDDVFASYNTDLVFLPFSESLDADQKYTTFDFFHAAIASEYFIGSVSGFSEIIKDVYRHKNSYICT
jgi:hypothetical protein